MNRRGEENLYQLLQVQPTADPEIIQAAYRRLMLRYHPDRNPGVDAHEITQRLNDAYEILSDPIRRAEYDRELLTDTGGPADHPPPPTDPPQPPPAGPRPGTGFIGGFPRWVWDVGLVGVIIAAVVIGIVILISTRESNGDGERLQAAAPLPTSTPEPTIVPLPTSSPIPRSRPRVVVAALPPTRTLRPTSVQRSTSTPRPTSTPTAQSHINKGAGFYGSKQYAQAIREFSSAISLSPGSALAYSYRGLAYYEDGQILKAIEDYDEAIELNPNDKLAFNNRGVAYLKLGQTKRAIEDYDKALSLDPAFKTLEMPYPLFQLQRQKQLQALPDLSQHRCRHQLLSQLLILLLSLLRSPHQRRRQLLQWFQSRHPLRNQF